MSGFEQLPKIIDSTTIKMTSSRDMKSFSASQSISILVSWIIDERDEKQGTRKQTRSWTERKYAKEGLCAPMVSNPESRKIFPTKFTVAMVCTIFATAVSVRDSGIVSLHYQENTFQVLAATI